MKKTKTRSKELKSFSLGSEKTEYPQTYAPEVLEAFENRHPHAKAWTSFVCTEFTSLCPKTGQPDFAKIFVNYIAADKMVESKSMKLYLFSFRNHGDFHEDCIQKICDDMQHLLSPHYIEVVGEFTPRGGIAIFPFAARHDGSAEFKRLHQSRFQQYAPGKYSMPLNRIY